jgi:hypothetical protein
MRRWNNRKPILRPEQSDSVAAEYGDVGETPPVLWSAEQLEALSPATGPGHRAIVPMVRSTPEANPLGESGDS